VAVDVLHRPALRFEALADVLAGGEVGMAVDRDAVVVPQADEVAELQVAGQASPLR
jgi:hypothetical protein